MPLSASDFWRSERWPGIDRCFDRRSGARLRWRAPVGLAGVLVSFACEPELVIGDWQCSGSALSEARSASDVAIPANDVEVPWETSFENGFCEFGEPGGFCFSNTSASLDVVSSPVHSGRWAASFHIVGEEADGLQARCARQGKLPEAAYYGAWFYIPSPVTAATNWNLFHFEGDPPDGGTEQWGLWDVSLALTEAGSLQPYVFDFLRNTARPLDAPRAVPVEQWFHLEVFLRRAADTTGRFTLYVDGAQSLDLDQVATDDSELGQWYVGNLATELQPSANTLFVDDVTISMVRQGAE